MERSRLRWLGSALVGAACVVPQGPVSGETSAPSAFVVLGQTPEGEPVALARLLIEQADADCPVLRPVDGQGEDRPMTARRNPAPGNFRVTVCEALYPMDGSRMDVRGMSLRLPAVPQKISRVAVFGDTGCKPADQDGCETDQDWPFSELANAAADPAPDLLLHMGDYNYRGTPGKIEIEQSQQQDKQVRVYDAGDNTPSVGCTLSGPYYGQNSAGSRTPDNWKAWRDDFFLPAANLLRVAPWVFTRGNHELCSRAGPGWFYFLDSGSDLVAGSEQLVCPPAESARPLIFRAPYRVDLGGLSIMVLDSANACDQGDLHQAHFDAQFAQIRSLVGDAPARNALWLQSHRPIWGLRKPDHGESRQDLDASGKYAVIDKTLQKAFADFPLPKPLHLVLAGHMHRFQAIDFRPPGVLPTELVVGNSGVDLEDNYPELPFSLRIGSVTAIGFGLSEFGYLEILLQDGIGWTGRMIDRKGEVRVNCDSRSASGTGACAPAES